jgi:FkbM family methyltransferase
MNIVKKSISFNVEPCTISKINDDWFGGSEKFWKDFVRGGWEPDTFSIFDKYCSKEHSYLDIGAWVGPTVLYGANLSKKCYAFEPDPTAFNFLKRNVLLNPNLNNIEIYPTAIAPHTGIIDFGSNTNMGDSMSSILWSKNSTPVDCITLEDFIVKNNIQDCNFIKMDIEGGEFSTLPSCRDILQKIKPTLYLSLHTPWFSNKKLFLETIVNSISFYKKIYTIDGKQLNYNDVLNLPNTFTSIVVTND